MNVPTFDAPTARQYAEEGRIGEWIHAYLNTGYWVNNLLDGLKRQQPIGTVTAYC